MQIIDHHRHTEWSLLDSCASVPSVVALGKKRKLPALTITDHGTLAGCYKFWKECKKNEIKPVLGCEVYFVESYKLEQTKIKYNYGHLVLLAMNRQGWENLKKLQEIAWENGFFTKPRIQFKDLIKYNEGLIVTTGCVNGLIGYFLSDKNGYELTDDKAKYEKICSVIRRLLKFFKGRMYAEMQLIDDEMNVNVNKVVLKISKRFKLPLIITQDGHYVKKQDSEIHDVVKCIQWDDKISDPENHTYKTKQLWYKNFKELKIARKKWHDYIPWKSFIDACKNTIKLSERIEEYKLLPDSSPLPVISDTPKEDLIKICKEHPLYSKLIKNMVYKERFEYEVKVISELNFCNYFLVVWDVMMYTKKKGIAFNSRGSVNGSLVAFFMNITWIDPIFHDCPFERFLTKDRLTLPDIDMDISAFGRASVIEYTRQKYGNDCVAHIGNYMKWKPKGAIKDAARVLGIKFEEVNAITKKIDDDIEWDQIQEIPEVADYLANNEEVHLYASGLLGLARQSGTHASGVVVTPTPITDWCPIAYSLKHGGKQGKRKDEKVTEWDMYDLEELGILKMDYLGSTMLDVIQETTRLITKNKPNKNFKTCDELFLYLIQNLGDERVYKMIGEGNNVGMFQLGTSDGMIRLAKDIVPSTFDDIVIIISLYRTAILQMGMHTEYVKRRFGEDYTLTHEKMHSILDKTMGVLIFQESCMKIGIEIAGLEPSEADNFRKGIKAKDPAKIQVWHEKFITGCKEKSDIDEDDAEEIWKFIDAFSGYGFCRAHACSYALVAYCTAWLKVYYPTEFMTALLTFAVDDNDKTLRYVAECNRIGVKLILPKINQSTDKFEMVGNDILYPLHAIKSVGGKALEKILEARKQGKFKSFEDFLERTKDRAVHSGIVEKLILGNAFSKFDTKENLYDKYVASKGSKDSGKQLYCSVCRCRYAIKPSSDSTVCPGCGAASVVVSDKMCKGKSFNDDYLQYILYGVSVRKSLLNQFVNEIAAENAEYLDVIEDADEEETLNLAFEVTKIKKFVDRNGNEMAFVDITDGTVDSSITVFSSDWEDLKEILTKGVCYVGKLKKSREKLMFNSRSSYISRLVKKQPKNGQQKQKES